ncbi:H-NS histone family protein [Alcaligenes phenolicus]|uniref:H-NS histone family protein n=1 Tax=Alcaligenes phenolicus TaxID=232846 RepID=A0AAW5W527_9BURK|nr:MULTISPECIES: H-NS histone family protein [Alcaligenes]MCX5567472.1 H-NS histone family protein [Alcaligenes phenolicus]
MRKELNSISEIKKEIARLQRDADKLKQKTRSKVVSDILRSMKENDLSPEDIAQAFHNPPLKTKAVSTIRYRHPDGHTWTGRGRTPTWIKQIESEGRSRDDFAVSNE